MKRQTKSIWQKQFLFATIATLIFIFAASSQVFAQKFKPGDSVECDPSGINDWMKGTVVDYLAKDNPTFQGEYYLTRVLIEKWRNSYPEGVLCQTKQVHLAKTPAAKTSQKPVEPKNKENPADNAVDEEAKSGAKFKPGDRVECDAAGINDWLKGTVLPFKENDNPGLDKDKSGKYFYIHRVLLDRDASTRPAGGMCFTDRTRLLAGGAPMEIPKTNIPIGKVTTDADNTLSADRPILDCPVAQTKVRNGARPNSELIKKIVRCDKGELPDSKGMDGAVTVDVTAIQFGAPRPWSPIADSGDGKAGTTVHPIKVTYTVRTFYRYRTAVEENWIRTINFYVNPFGEWQSGSEIPVKSPQLKDIPRLP